MVKTIISRISGGLGNQLFIYASTFALAKKNNAKLLIDNRSSYYKKNVYKYELNNFNISSKYAISFVFDTLFKNIKRKFLKIINFFSTAKFFYFEQKYKNKLTKYSYINLKNYNDKVIFEGNFESEKYFIEYRNFLLNEFKPKKDFLYKNKYKKLILNNPNRIVSICVRQNRFSEKKFVFSNSNLILKSTKFTKDNINYINRAIAYVKKKINNPIFLLWSNSFYGLSNVFNNEKIINIINKNNKHKIIVDFSLLLMCKNFIVAPSTYHWWAAWLCEHKKGLIIRPKDMNPSNNKDFWPSRWISI